MKKILLLTTIICLLLIMVGCGTKEIKNEELDKKLEFDTNNLKYTNYEVDGKTINVTLTYDENVMIIGVMKKIRTLIKNEFGDTYKVINLNVVQTNPPNSINYTFKENKWDRAVQ